MIDKKLLQEIVKENGFNLLPYKPLTGGDIHAVFYLKCKNIDLVVKINDALAFPKMFETEAKGLNLLQSTQSFKIPKVIRYGSIGNNSYLLLSYIEQGQVKSDFWSLFAKNLAKMHQNTSNHFGLDHNNYIGSLPQYNGFEKTAAKFYINQRLKPQFKLAQQKGFKFNDLDKFYVAVSAIIPNEPPALIHGDLWNGNYMISKNGKPVLIDPAVSYAPREMDLAMMQLFGGFSNEVFKKYDAIFPLKKNWEERINLWQLYYLLVHLNLFGTSYLSSVNSIVKKYS